MIAAALIVLATVCGDVQRAYVAADTTALRDLLTSAPAEADSLLARYRLYSLTRESSLLDELPADVRAPAGRSLAYLSALWGFRAERAGVVGRVTAGGRSVALLERAKHLAPSDPVVSLIEGQSLLFRPAFAGGSRRRALERFTAARDRLAATSDCAADVVEADTWRWYALRSLDRDRAAALRERLLRGTPEKTYRDFLTQPPP